MPGSFEAFERKQNVRFFMVRCGALWHKRLFSIWAANCCVNPFLNSVLGKGSVAGSDGTLAPKHCNHDKRSAKHSKAQEDAKVKWMHAATSSWRCGSCKRKSPFFLDKVVMASAGSMQMIPDDAH
jgi:hypothetical protein